MKLLILPSPDLSDTTLAEAFDQAPLHILPPGSGQLADARDPALQSSLFNLHQSILEDHQKTWFQPLSYKHQHPDLRIYRDRLAPIIDSMGASWVVQDSLLCQLLSLWRPLVDDAVVFLYYSDPLECAATLQNRWRFPISFGLALWEHYLVSALNQLDGLSCIPVSHSRLRESPVASLRFLGEQIEQIDPRHTDSITENIARWESLVLPSRPELNDHAEFLQEEQRELYTRLEQGKIDGLQGITLSPQSADSLEYYGQLRAGYDTLRAERSILRESRPAHPQENTTEMTEPPEQDSPEEMSETLLAVRVHISGLPAIEFLAEADSPVLSMLAGAMQASDTPPEELVYLDYTDDASGALYFRRSSLLGFEIEPATP